MAYRSNSGTKKEILRISLLYINRIPNIIYGLDKIMTLLGSQSNLVKEIY